MPATCQNCGSLWDESELKEIKDLHQRVAPGEPMPSGECPECGALCQPVKEKTELVFDFTVVLRGTGEDKEEAWENAVCSLYVEPGPVPTDYELVNDEG